MGSNSNNMKIDISTGTLIRVIVLGFLVLALIKLINVVLMVMTAIVISSFVHSAVAKINPTIKNRTLSVFLIYVITIVSFVWLASIFVPAFIGETSSLVSQLGQYIPDNNILNSFQPDTLSGAKSFFNTISHNGSLSDIIKSTQNLVNTLAGGFFDIFGQAFGGVFNLCLIIIISFYLSIKEKGIENFLRLIIPDHSEEYVVDLWSRSERKIGLWVQGQFITALITGVLTYLGLTILRVKYSFVIALFTSIAGIVPLGIFIAFIPAVLFSYLSGGITTALLTVALYFILHQFENYLISPLIVKKIIGISPLVVILSILIGAELAGFWGVILAIPCAVCLFEFLDDLERKKISI